MTGLKSGMRAVALCVVFALVMTAIAFGQNRFDGGGDGNSNAAPVFQQPGFSDGGAAADAGSAAVGNSAATTSTLIDSNEASTAGDEETAAGGSDAAVAPAGEAAGTSGVSGFLSAVMSAGPMMIPIVGCSLLLVMFVLERAIALRRSRVIPKHFVKLFLTEIGEGQLKPGEALESCEENHSPIAEVFAAAVKKWSRPSVEVEQAVIDAGERVANGLRRYLRLFNGIATISPLLGLLGTVLGMIRAFNAIASSDAMGRPELLAEGISQALLTTAGGLSVAIPAFIAYMYFTSRVDRLIIEIDGLGQEVVGAIASDAWKPGAKKKTSSRAA